jgi:phasin
MLDSPTKTTATKTASSPTRDGAQAFRATAENGFAQTKESFEKLSAGTTEATAVIQDCYSTAVKGVQGYNAKALEFAKTNTETAINFAQKLTAVKSPSEFMKLSTDHSHKQFETLTEQTKALAALAQQVTLATAEHLNAHVSKTFSQSV